MANSFEDYLDECRKKVNELLVPGKAIYQFVRDKRGMAKGVVTLHQDPEAPGVYRIGWSLCNKLDRFNKLVGLDKALKRSIDVSKLLQVDGKWCMVHTNAFIIEQLQEPHTIRPVFERMIERAKAFGKKK